MGKLIISDTWAVTLGFLLFVSPIFTDRSANENKHFFTNPPSNTLKIMATIQWKIARHWENSVSKKRWLSKFVSIGRKKRHFHPGGTSRRWDPSVGYPPCIFKCILKTWLNNQNKRARIGVSGVEALKSRGKTRRCWRLSGSAAVDLKRGSLTSNISVGNLSARLPVTLKSF